VLQRLVRRLRREAFLPTPLGIVVSSVYLIRRALYENIRELAPRLTGDVLDFGCGSKPYESLFVNARRYVGVDVPVSGHDHRTSRIDVFYDGRTLPFRDGQFDGVVAFEVFEHVFNIDDAVTELRRVLKPGGQLLVSLPFAWDEHEVPYDFARYTSFGIRHVLERNGFEIVEMRKSNTYILALSQIFIDYLRRYVFPRNGVLRGAFQLGVIFPLNVGALALNAVLPKRDELYSNNVVLARTSIPA
jgi:SAM-dependent methyltransferase